MTAARFLIVTIAAFVLGYTSYSIDKRERLSPDNDSKLQLYTPYVSSMLLSIVVLIIPILSLMFFDVKTTILKTLGILFPIFFQIFIYYIVLMLLLPLLRKYISARACYILWLIPNYLYLMQYDILSLDKPYFIISAPSLVVTILSVIWITVFFGIMAWKIISHIKFRRYILKNSSPITDENIINLWISELQKFHMRRTSYPLYYSNAVKTPISIGLFQRKIFVVLPEKSYSDDELQLIFRHEIVHIGRCDSCSKFFHVFCTAICWFNPLMWFGMRKSADDIELSCDESVLIDADEQTRAKYASLILETAGDERGFTTCLSSSANALRYRLKNIIKPSKKFSGAIIIGIIFAVLCLTTGYTSLVYGDFTGKDILFSSGNVDDFKLESISIPNNSDTAYICEDEKALAEYLSSLKIQNITGIYNFDDSKKKALTICYETSDEFIILKLFDNFMYIAPRIEMSGFDYYYLPDGVDYNRINELITTIPAAYITISDPYTNNISKLPATLLSLDKVTDGEIKNVFKREDTYDYSGFGGYDSTEFQLDFKMKLIGDYTVKITPFNSQNTTILYGSELEKPFTIPILNESANYIINGTFENNDGNIFNTEFGFHLLK